MYQSNPFHYYCLLLIVITDTTFLDILGNKNNNVSNEMSQMIYSCGGNSRIIIDECVWIVQLLLVDIPKHQK